MAVRELDLGSVIGPKGPQGIQGETGPTGPQGATGAKGADGATWLSGTAAPTTQGANGDYFINTVTWDIYKKASGTWSKSGNIKGAKGDIGAAGAKGDKGDTGARGATGAQGPQGAQGEKGDPFAIAKTYASIAAMNAGYASDGVKQGQFVLIDTGNVEDEDNAKLYVKGAAAYSYITDLSGAKGMTGPQGPKGATGSQGPQGMQGPKGDTGATGPKGADGATPEFEIRNGHLFAIYPS